MTAPEPLPVHLDRLGTQLIEAARRLHASAAHAQRRQWRSLVLVPAAILAATAVVVLLITGTGSRTTPAYALTRHANGSITITLSELSTGIPALNARLKGLGINTAVIPIRAGCESPDGSGNIIMHPDPHLEYSGSISITLSSQRARRHPATPGFHYVLAAKRLANGKILGFIGALKAPVPTCLPYSSTPSTSLAPL